MLNDKWLILRTSSRTTVRLVESLTAHGFEAWTPVHTLMKRAAHRRSAGQLAMPMLPSFAFASANHVQDLIDLAAALSKPHPDFSLFLNPMTNRPALVSGEQLTPLRWQEERDRKRAELARRNGRSRDRLRNGTPVHLSSGAYAGLNGTVIADDGKYAEVNLGKMTVKISSFLLRSEDICSAKVA